MEFTLNRIEKLVRLVGPDPLRRRSSRHPQCSFDRIDHMRTYLHTRIEPAQFIVEIPSGEHSMTKDASSHGHRDGTILVFRKKTIHHNGGDLCEFPTGVRLDLQGKNVFASGNGRKECGEVGRGNRVGGSGKVGQRRHAPDFAQCPSECSVKDVLSRSISPVASPKNGADGDAADPVSGTFVADGESPTSGTRGPSLPVAAVRNGARAGNDNYARAGVEGRFQGNLHVADNVDGGGQNLGQNATHCLG
jgi:hypothetical protein